MNSRWERCILQKGDDTERFIRDFFGEDQRRLLLIGGAGFDPRATRVAEMLSPVLGDRLHALLLREERPDPDASLVGKAEKNIEVIATLISATTVRPIQIFAQDEAVIGGREAVNVLKLYDLRPFTDVAVDASALSRGVVFPIVRFLLQSVGKGINVHLLVSDDPGTDIDISAIAWDQPGYVHGFKGDSESANNPDAAKLWLPQLVIGERTSLERIHAFIEPHDVCPIVPFPTQDPKAPDRLIEHFADQLQAWAVDPRNVIYAHESNPLDLYRAIIRIGDARREIFAGTIGSKIVLSPVGSKVLSLGALMAAVERDFPVVYAEAVAYKMTAPTVCRSDFPILHLWLQGQAYEEQAESPNETT
jgi:hypothetical protein